MKTNSVMKSKGGILIKRIIALIICALLLACVILPALAEDAEMFGDILTEAGDAEETTLSLSECFSNRDFDIDYSDESLIAIQLSGSTAACNSSAVTVNGGSVTITDEGTYILSGTLSDGSIIVDAEKTDKIRLVLAGVSISSADSAAIYVAKADKVFVTLAANTVNTLTSRASAADETEDSESTESGKINAAVYSKEDITFSGAGSLTVSAPAGHGIVSKDDLKLTGGSYVISTAAHGLKGKDSVCIAGAEIEITAGKDGIHSKNADDESKGYVYIASGTIKITAQGDGISASSQLCVDDGSINIVAGGGSANATKKSGDSFGFSGGGRGGYGNRGGMPSEGSASSSTSSETVSTKALKAAGKLTVSGGSFTIDSADDAVHTNGSALISGGSFTIATGDDGFHADENLTISGGDINISACYEGLEALHVVVSGGNIALVATDDGINAAGGTDESGYGGNTRGDRFGGMSSGSSNGSILISGGNVFVTSSGDGIDANGTFEMTGGYVIVCGPTSGDTATLDYDISGIITGGTFIGTGSTMMAQSFSDSEQGVIAVNAGSQSAGTQITLESASGETLITRSPELSFAVVIISDPRLQKGEAYSLYVGTVSGTVTAN